MVSKNNIAQQIRISAVFTHVRYFRYQPLGKIKTKNCPRCEFRIILKIFFIFFQYIMCFLGMSKKNPLFVWRWDGKNLSIAITYCHHLASLVMPIGHPWERFFYPTRTLMMDSYMDSYITGGFKWRVQSSLSQWDNWESIKELYKKIEPNIKPQRTMFQHKTVNNHQQNHTFRMDSNHSFVATIYWQNIHLDTAVVETHKEDLTWVLMLLWIY